MKTAIILYCPVVHNGYLNLLKIHGSHTTPVFLMGGTVLQFLRKNHESIIEPIRRDMRALPVRESAAALSFIYEGSVQILEHEEICLLREYDKIILPEDEISHAFTEEYEEYVNYTEFTSWFLRWNMPASTTRSDVECDRVVSKEQLLALGFFTYVEKARAESLKSPDWWRQVGSVLVCDGKEILSAHNTHLPTLYEVYFSGDPRANFDAGQHIEVSKAIHSEASIIAQAAQYGVVTKGAELFVTTFPCPACANLIAMSGIKKMYFVDGYSIVGALDVLRHFGVEVIRVI